MRGLGSLLAIAVPIGLVLAGCGGKDVPPLTVGAASPGLSRGIDMATDSRDVSQELKGSGLQFVARYYRDPASRLPPLSPEEARAVTEAGMKLVTVWQYKSNKPEHFSYAAGQADGMAAHRQAKAVGQPPGTAIYFAVDYNAPEPDIRSLIDPYFRGVAAGLAAAAGKSREYRIGVYSSGAVCGYLKGARLAEYAWLSHSRAWAGYDSFTKWDIKQGARTTALSFDHDINEARGEFGAFTPTGQTHVAAAGS
jgi:hypothetical protein